MVYQYRGKLTINEVDRYEQALKTMRAEVRAALEQARQETKRANAAEARNKTLVVENMTLKQKNTRLTKINYSARRTIGALEGAAEKYKETLRILRRDKKRLQSRIIGLKKVRPVKKPKPHLAPVADIIQLSGPEGLAAAVAEARRYSKARNAA